MVWWMWISEWVGLEVSLPLCPTVTWALHLFIVPSNSLFLLPSHRLSTTTLARHLLFCPLLPFWEEEKVNPFTLGSKDAEKILQLRRDHSPTLDAFSGGMDWKWMSQTIWHSRSSAAHWCNNDAQRLFDSAIYYLQIGCQNSIILFYCWSIVAVNWHHLPLVPVFKWVAVVVDGVVVVIEIWDPSPRCLSSSHGERASEELMENWGGGRGCLQRKHWLTLRGLRVCVCALSSFFYYPLVNGIKWNLDGVGWRVGRRGGRRKTWQNSQSESFTNCTRGCCWSDVSKRKTLLPLLLIRVNICTYFLSPVAKVPVSTVKIFRCW